MDQATIERLFELIEQDPSLGPRIEAIREVSTSVRASEYHVTNACNLRCEGCWFFANEFDEATKDERDLDHLRAFIGRERERGVNTALLIGGEPTLHPKRVRAYVDGMDNVTISTNGIRPLPRDGFEDVMVAITLFGGGPLDDQLRGIRPNGSRFEGLLDQALENYRGDERAGFVLALTEEGIPHIEPTVRKIADEGHPLIFNYYSAYGTESPLFITNRRALLDEALRVQAAYSDTVLSHPHLIRALITGRSHGAEFGYDVCPSISFDHPDHAERRRNGNPTLPGFKTWAADCKTVEFCCTSGGCSGCRDSQAVSSWLMVSWTKFLGDVEELTLWLDVAERYWSQFSWSPFAAPQFRKVEAVQP